MNTIVSTSIKNPFNDNFIDVELPLFVTGFIREDGYKFINMNIALTINEDGSLLSENPAPLPQ
jgi:hypothetical protein